MRTQSQNGNLISSMFLS